MGPRSSLTAGWHTFSLYTSCERDRKHFNRLRQVERRQDLRTQISSSSEGMYSVTRVVTSIHSGEKESRCFRKYDRFWFCVRLLLELMDLLQYIIGDSDGENWLDYWHNGWTFSWLAARSWCLRVSALFCACNKCYGSAFRNKVTALSIRWTVTVWLKV